jgi:hypothetical protein
MIADARRDWQCNGRWRSGAVERHDVRPGRRIIHRLDLTPDQDRLQPDPTGRVRQQSVFSRHPLNLHLLDRARRFRRGAPQVARRVCLKWILTLALPAPARNTAVEMSDARIRIVYRTPWTVRIAGYSIHTPNRVRYPTPWKFTSMIM